MTGDANPTRRRALRTVGGLLTVGLAGCNALGTGGESTADSRPSDDSSTSESGPHSQTHTHEHTRTERERTASETESDFNLTYDDRDLHATLVAEVDVPDDEVLLGYHLLDGPLPFTTEVYRAPADAAFQATETYDTQDLADVSLLPDDPEPLPTLSTSARDIHYGTVAIGEPLAVTLVARHDGDTFDWRALHRSGYPHDGNDGNIEVDCYCSGEIYTAPGGGTWARVIQVTPTDAVDPGTGNVVSWTSNYY